jgi:hypothetical protein
MFGHDRVVWLFAYPILLMWSFGWARMYDV